MTLYHSLFLSEWLFLSLLLVLLAAAVLGGLMGKDRDES